MSTILFNSHQSKAYKTEQWRHIFSQWYCSGKPFIGMNAIHDLSQFILKDDWEKLVLNVQFWLREQWMMYIKALVLAKGEHRDINLDIAKKIIATNDPNIIKQLGRTVKGYDDKIWDECKFKIVVNGNYLEFSQNKEMREILINTGNRNLAECSYKDRIWGVGYNITDAAKTPENKWGLNLLGKAIVEARQHLIQ